MPEIRTRFERAVDEVEELPHRPDPATLLRLYALYKQAVVGDATGERPGAFDLKGRAKYDAWAALRGTGADEAMEGYADLVDELKG
jgi:acyl-CoA-binding protein